MKLKNNFIFSSLYIAMLLPAFAKENNSNISTEKTNEAIESTEEILILGVRSDRYSKGATGLTMEISETPQSISVITADLIKNFSANDLNDALKLATGVNVQDYETNRTRYTSRGFDIKNTQIDGVGMPNSWGIVTGAMESYGYEKIEVIRGANGLLTGVGNSAGTINYVRKRPTNKNQGEIGLSIGSYNLKRLQADYSILLTENGSWAARAIAVAEDKESHVESLSNDRTYLYGIIDGQLTDNSTLTFGLAHQETNTNGNMWGGLVLNYSDGTQAEWDTSATTAQNWTYWNTVNTNAFVEYSYILANDWELKATYNKQKSNDPSKLFYVYGTINKETGLGLNGWPGRYESDFDADLIDVSLLGDFKLFGKYHELNLGISQSQSNTVSHNYTPLSGFEPTPAFPYKLNAIAEPAWGERTKYADIDMTIKRFFGSTKLNISNNLFVVTGFNAIKFTRKGINSGVNVLNNESEISPYIGATYAVTNEVNAYVSYSDIYQPQEQYNYDGYFLDPTKGINVELGLKTHWFDKKLLANLALFTAEQDNLATYAGQNADNLAFYKGHNVESKGFELELVGRINDNLNIVLGYTNVKLEDDNGNKTNEWIPRDLVKFSLNYTLPQTSNVTLGLGGKWQSKIKNTTNNVVQDDYLLMNAFARWNISKKLILQANINNLTDEKYINSLYQVGYFGAPTNGTLNLTYSF